MCKKKKKIRLTQATDENGQEKKNSTHERNHEEKEERKREEITNIQKNNSHKKGRTNGKESNWDLRDEICKKKNK